jgi:adenosylmethionine-8-amino-7-oxononanoate aminotransferase
VAEGSRDFSHGHTFNGYGLGCAAGLAILKYLDDHRLVERVARKGPELLDVLRTQLAGAPMVNEVRGEGFLFGVTYRDEDGRFLDPELRVGRRIDVAALDERLLTYSTQPTADGYAGDQTLLSPSYLTTDEDWEEIARRFRRSIETVAEDVKMGAPMAAIVG